MATPEEAPTTFMTFGQEQKKSSVGIFWQTVTGLAGAYLALKFAFPYFAMILAGKDHPLPVPKALMIMYMTLAAAAAFVQITYDDATMAEFKKPILSFLKGAETAKHKAARAGILVSLPLLAGHWVYTQSVPSSRPPVEARLQHPTLPGKFEKLENPFRNPDDAQLKQFIAEQNLGPISPEKAKALFLQNQIEQGRVLYQRNCSPCHGVKADGAGPMARAFRLRPADFTDAGTIATLVEPYLFWRITEGGIGLPPEASPWDSAMPSWKEDLTPEEIWKIILAEFDIAGMEPRKLEK